MNTGTKSMESRELMPGLHRSDDGRNTRITFRWFYGAGSLVNKILEILFLVFGIIVVIFTAGGIANIFIGKSNFSLGLIDSFFFIAGIILAYRGLLTLVNHSTFEISPEGLAVRHGPLPGAGNLDLPKYEVAGVEWQKVGQTRNSGNSGTRLTSGYSAIFDVILRTTSGKTLTLVSGIRARDYAFALSSEITNLLK